MNTNFTLAKVSGIRVKAALGLRVLAGVDLCMVQSLVMFAGKKIFFKLSSFSAKENVVSTTGRKPVSAVFVSCIFFGAFIVAALLTGRCLYADGSFYFLKMLEAGNFTEIIPCRSFASYLFEAPFVLALKLGVTGIPWLTLAFGIGCLCAWPVALVLCYRMAPQHFWLVLFACAAGYLNAAFMAVGEHVVAHAFFWPALFAILFVRPLTPFAAISLLASTIILMRSYESMLFLGPPMIALLFWRMVFDRETLWRQAVLGAAIVFVAVAVYIAWVGVKYPNVVNYTGFKEGFFLEMTQPTWTLKMTIGWIVLMLAASLTPLEKFLKRPIGLALTAAWVLVWGAWPLLAPSQLDPESQYECRFLDLLVPLALIPFAMVLAMKPKWLAGQIPGLARLAAIMLIAQSLWHLSATYQWARYLHSCRQLLAANNGPIQISDDHCFKNSILSWVNPSMSLLIGPEKVHAIILSNKPGWQPFDPLNPHTLPDFKRYGLDYTLYIAALRDQNLSHE